jgi:hypothetical protein
MSRATLLQTALSLILGKGRAALPSAAVVRLLHIPEAARKMMSLLLAGSVLDDVQVLWDGDVYRKWARG